MAYYFNFRLPPIYPSSISGTQGNDYFTGTSTAHHYQGWGGEDTVSYVKSNAGVTVDLATGTGTGGAAQGDSYKSIENITGSSYSDNFVGSSANNTFFGRGGNDAFISSRGNDKIDGGSGTDAVSYAGNSAGITANLETGIVNKGGSNGTDAIDNIEIVYGSNYVDTIAGSSDNDRIFGEGGDDTITGGGGSDTISGGNGHDDLFGNDGKDFIAGGIGDDFIDGGAGVDTVIYQQANAGIDLDLNESLVFIGNDEVDTISNIENVIGSNFADDIRGNTDDNVIAGQGGNDWLFDEEGDDVYSGGAGADRFIFLEDDNHGDDTIVDFEINVDKIDLDGTDISNWNDLTNGGSRRMEQVGNDTVIYTNNGVDGDSITLLNVQMSQLDANDFIF